MRANLILLAVVVVCALALVTSSHRARSLFTDLEHEQAHMRDLETEWNQLQLEQSTWANHARIEKIAHSKLGMKAPAADRIASVGGSAGAGGGRP